jgi:hypothetical protein
MELSRTVGLFVQGHYVHLERKIACTASTSGMSRSENEREYVLTGVENWTGDLAEVGRTGNIILDENKVWTVEAEEKRLGNQRQRDFRHVKDALEKRDEWIAHYDTLPTYAEDITVVEKPSK